jgi:hypothetical protein
MATLGAAVTDNFSIGVAEVRLGEMASAGKLSQANSIGLVDQANVSIAQTSVDLKGGFPRKLVASAVTEQTGTASATFREYSRRNMNIILGNGIPAAATDAATTVTADVLISATSLVVDDATGFAVGDVVVIYQEGKPESVSVVKLTAVDTVDPDGLTFAANSLTQAYVVANGTVKVYKANPVQIGAVSRVNYFAATLIQQGSSGDPVIWNFWKCSIGGNMDYATSAEDFASSTMELKILEPAASDYGVGGPLVHVADMIADHPMGMAILG